jgi:hypothetical protein
VQFSGVSKATHLAPPAQKSPEPLTNRHLRRPEGLTLGVDVDDDGDGGSVSGPVGVGDEGYGGGS